MTERKSQHLSNRRNSHRARIARSFDVVEQIFEIGGHAIPFLRVRDPDVVLDQIVVEADRRAKVDKSVQDDDELHLPYWAELWDSAIGVSEWLVREESGLRVQGSAADALNTSSRNPEPRTLNPFSVLDLGCGMGLAGTVAAMLGHRVLFGDIEKPALLFARYNATQFDPRARAWRVDWKRTQLGERFNLIIGADVLYDKTQWEFLEPFWRAHLKPNGKIILGEPGRQTGEMFVEWLAARGEWVLNRSSVKVATRDTPIKLFELRARS